jgi:hypothetical protein
VTDDPEETSDEAAVRDLARVLRLAHQEAEGTTPLVAWEAVARAAMQIGARTKPIDPRARLDDLMGPDSTDFLGTGLTLRELTQLGVMEKLASSWSLQPRAERRRRLVAVTRLSVELARIRETVTHATRLADLAIESVIEGDWKLVEEWAEHFAFDHDESGSKNAIAYATFRELLLQVLRAEKGAES